MKKLIAFVFGLICALGLFGCSSEPKTFEIGFLKIRLQKLMFGNKIKLREYE